MSEHHDAPKAHEPHALHEEHACMLDLWLIVSTQVLRDRP